MCDTHADTHVQDETSPGAHFPVDVDILRLISQEMDVETALKARVVCKSLHRAVKDSALEPLLSEDSAHKLSRAKTNEHETLVMNPAYYVCDAIDENMQRNANGWRTIIVDWIIHLNLHFNLPEYFLHTAVRIRDSYQGYKTLHTRSAHYILGITAFKIAYDILANDSDRVLDFDREYMPLLSAALGYTPSNIHIIIMQKNIIRHIYKNDFKMQKPSTVQGYLQSFLLLCTWSHRETMMHKQMTKYIFKNDFNPEASDMFTSALHSYLTTRSRLRAYPKITDFLRGYLQAAKLEDINPVHACDIVPYSRAYSTALFFIDMSLLNSEFIGKHPSDLAAAAVICTLRVFKMPDWNKHLTYYTKFDAFDTQQGHVLRTLADSVMKTAYSWYMDINLEGAVGIGFGSLSTNIKYRETEFAPDTLYEIRNYLAAM